MLGPPHFASQKADIDDIKLTISIVSMLINIIVIIIMSVGVYPVRSCCYKVTLVASFIFLVLVFLVGGAVVGMMLGIIGRRFWLAKGAAIGGALGLVVGIIIVIPIYWCTVKVRRPRNGGRGEY